MTQLPGTTWNFPPAELHLKEDEVHLWRISVTEMEESIETQTLILSVEELERAKRFHFDVDRNRFILSHGTLREILSQYLGLPPEEIVFGHGDHGKPNLDPVPQNEGVRFNLSHSGDIVLIAFGRHREIGVDVEKIRPEIELDRLAQRFFSPGEVESLSSLDTEHRLAAFFRCWTRKEAYIKALGGGLSIPLDQFEVTLEPNTPPALSANWEDPDEVARWSLYNIELGDDYLAALAVEGRPEQIQYWHFTPAPITTETKKT